MPALIEQKFWKNKRVFVTGNTGFKGSWMCLLLQNLGAIVKGFSLEVETKPSMFVLANIEDDIDTEFNNILNYDALAKSMKSFNPEILIHLAAQPIVQLSYLKPQETYFTNVMGTVNVLEAGRSCSNLQAILNITSDKCYENNEWEWGYRENDRLGGFDPYSSSKACAELITNSYRNSFFSYRNAPNIATARAGNVIGGGDWSDNRLFPDLIRSVENQSELIIRNPDALRPWQHVLDCLSGYLILCQNLYLNQSLSGSWNFGPDNSDTHTVRWMLNYTKEHFEHSFSWKLDGKATTHESQMLKLDVNKSKNKLNWQSIWNTEQAIDKTLIWYSDYFASKNLKTTTLNQITEYQYSAEKAIFNKIHGIEFSE